MVESHGLAFILCSLLVALLLSIVPIAGNWVWLRPDWVLLLLVYFLLTLPERVGVIVCWTTGLLLDILHGAVLGQNAFAFAVIAYVIQVSYQRLRMFSLRKQAALILLCTLFHVLVEQWAQGLNGAGHFRWQIFLPILSTALCWFLLRPFMAWMSRVFVVH